VDRQQLGSITRNVTGPVAIPESWRPISGMPRTGYRGGPRFDHTDAVRLVASSSTVSPSSRCVHFFTGKGVSMRLSARIGVIGAVLSAVIVMVASPSSATSYTPRLPGRRGKRDLCRHHEHDAGRRYKM
jgi:hypothetical protein